MSKRYWPTTGLLVLLILFVSSCGNAASASPTSGAPASFTLVYQPGLGAAAFVTLKQQKTLEKQFPHTNIQWKIVNSGAAVREAVLPHQGDLGSLGIPPFLVGWDKGMDWRVLLASTRTDNWLVAMNPKFKSLKDFGPNDKIGLVAPDSQQSIQLRKAAQEQLGDAHALDRNLVAIGSADGEVALRSGQLAAQISGSPFQEREIAAGGHIILHSNDTFGPVGGGVIALPQSFYNQYPTFSKAVYQDFLSATSYVTNHHEEAAQYLAADKASGGGGSADQFKSLLDETSVFVYDPTPSGLLVYAQFMKSIGFLTKSPASANDLLLPTVVGKGS